MSLKRILVTGGLTVGLCMAATGCDDTPTPEELQATIVNTIDLGQVKSVEGIVRTIEYQSLGYGYGGSDGRTFTHEQVKVAVVQTAEGYLMLIDPHSQAYAEDVPSNIRFQPLKEQFLTHHNYVDFYLNPKYYALTPDEKIHADGVLQEQGITRIVKEVAE